MSRRTVKNVWLNLCGAAAWIAVCVAAVAVSGCRTPKEFGPAPGGGMAGPAYCPPAMMMGGMGTATPLPFADAGGEHPTFDHPYPRDEYLFDGGDTELGVRVAPDWRMEGLDLSDTVAHYDTLDGRTLVEPSNRVALYAPRFAAVRVVTRLAVDEQIQHTDGSGTAQSVAKFDELGMPMSSLQQDQPHADIGRNLAEAYITDDGEGLISGAVLLRAVHEEFLAYENLEIIRSGSYDLLDTAMLDRHVDAAITWSKDDTVGVMLDEQWASPLTKDTRGQVIYSVEDRRDNPQLRVIKVASTDSAQPGEYVDFTIRFDNVGDQPLGNIVLVDNLTTRLEYVADSGQASVDVRASQKANDGQSLELRWQILEPLAPGDGGIIRFRCKVR